MQPDWDYVKKTTLWQYEPPIKKLQIIRAYPVLWQAYNHDMAQAAAFARSLFPDANIEEGDYPAGVIDTLERLQGAGVNDWQDLLCVVHRRPPVARSPATWPR